MRGRAARRGSWQAWLSASALLACFTLLFNLAALGARSSATEELKPVGPAAITITTQPAHVASSSAVEPKEASLAAAEPDDDPVAAEATAASSLGRTVLLNVARQPAAVGHGPVFAYTPYDEDASATAPLAVLDGERLWQQPTDGMSPVIPAGGATLGYAYPHDGLRVRPLAVSAAGTTVVSNLAAGGATWEWTDTAGTQYLNHYDLGREVQASFFIRTSDGRKLNPTEAGDRYGDSRVTPVLRHSSPLANAGVEGARQQTISVPLEWSPPRVDARAGNAHPVIYPDVRLGKDLQLAFGGRADVARYDTILSLPAATHGDLEAPTAYVRNSFSHLFTFDARSRILSPIAPTPFDKKGLDWSPPSGRGALIASDAAGMHAFAIYAVTTDAGGTITRFTAHDFHVPGGASGAEDVGTVKLRALRIGDFPAGETRTTAYVVTGTLASVQMEMAALARDSLR